MADETTVVTSPDDEEERKSILAAPETGPAGPDPNRAPLIEQNGRSILAQPAPSIRSVADSAPPMQPPTITNPTPTAAPAGVGAPVDVMAGPPKPQTPKDVAISHMSAAARQNPFTMLMADSKNIHNPFARIMAELATGVGAGAEGLSKNYPEIERERAAEAEQPSVIAGREAETAGRQAQTGFTESETNKNNIEAGLLKNPIPKMVEIAGSQGANGETLFRDETGRTPGAFTLGPGGYAPYGVAAPATGATVGPATSPTPPPVAGPPQPPIAGPQNGTVKTKTPQATPEEAAKLAPVGDDGASTYNQQIKDALGKDAKDFQVTPTDSRERADQILKDARAQATSDREAKSAERVAGAPEAAQARKDARTMGYALDANGNLAYMSKADADKIHSTFEEMKTTDVKADRTALRQLDDVQLNTSRYTKAANDYAAANLSKAQKASDNTGLDDLLNKAGIADLKLGGLLEVDLPLLSSATEALSRESKSESYNKLTPQGKDLYDGYLRTMSAIVAYQKALTGIGRTNKETLDLELNNIANPTMRPEDILRKQGQFQENIDTAAQGFPSNLPGIKLPKQVRDETEGQSSASWEPPKGAPSAKGIPDGKILKMNGQILAVAKAGSWTRP